MQLTQISRGNIRSLLEQCDVAYEITPFDEDLYQECIEDAMQRGYPVDGDHSVRTYLREGIYYAATAGLHLPHRPTQIWVALYTSCAFYVGDAANRFPEELYNISLFNDRLVRKEPQGSGVLDAFADVIRRASDLYRPIASHLITSSTLNFVIANLLERETSSLMTFHDSQQCSSSPRIMSGIGEAFAFMVFPREISVNDYIQAIPEIALFINNAHDVFSFYKQERVNTATNHTSVLAGRTKISESETYGELTETTIELYKRILEILEGSLEACGAFRHFTAGFVRFHTSIALYQLEDLDL